jgi:hypothetical protein
MAKYCSVVACTEQAPLSGIPVLSNEINSLRGEKIPF